MVPGMNERDYRAADAGRRDWLADARRGPARIAHAPAQAQRAVTLNGVWREVFGTVRRHALRIRLLPGASKPLPKRTPAPSR